MKPFVGHAWTDQEIDQVIEVRHVKFTPGRGDPITEGERFRSALKLVFISTPEIRSLLRTFANLLLVQFEAIFKSEAHYLQGINLDNPWLGHEVPMVFVTGLAGVGKTRIWEAFFKLLGSPVGREMEGYSGLRTAHAWPVSLANGVSWEAMFSPFLNDRKDGVTRAVNHRGRRVDTVTRELRRLAWLESVFLLWVDEFQRVSYGFDSHAKAAKIIQQLIGLGPRICIIANFSLVNALFRRNDQDRQRILGLPIVIEPEAADGPNLPALLKAYQEAVPSVFDFELELQAADIHKRTYGVKRIIVALLSDAYSVAVSEGRAKITLGDLEAASRTERFRSNRETVTKLFTQASSNTQMFDDLACPWSIPMPTRVKPKIAKAGDDGVISDGLNEPTPAELAKAAWDQRVADRLLLDALTPEEATAIRTFQAMTSEAKTRGANVSNNGSRPKGKKATTEDLLKNLKTLGRPW